MIRLLIIAGLLAAALPACKRRAPGTCADHVDCGPGYDCVEGRCSKRPPVGGEPTVAPPPPPVPPSAADPEPLPSIPVVPSAPVAPPVDSLPTRPAPKAKPPAPLPAPTPPADREPMWKQRRKNA